MSNSRMIFAVSYGNESASSSISDVDLHVIITKLLHSIFNTLLVRGGADKSLAL
jgi:hypothetical protein